MEQETINRFSHQNAYGDDEFTREKTMRGLLKEQYQCTLHYCNATTALHNSLVVEQDDPSEATTTTYNTTTTTRNSSLNDYLDALHQLHTCQRELMQFNQQLLLLQQQDPSRSVSQKCFTQHVARSHRILCTLYTSSSSGMAYDSFGLPSAAPAGSSSSSTVDDPFEPDSPVATRLVGLATVRASMHSVLETL